MKKLLVALLIALMATVPLLAEKTVSHDNRLYIRVEESLASSAVPVTLHLENPTIGITAVEVYFTFPEGVVVSSSELSSRCTDTHAVTVGNTSRGYFLSIASDVIENFAETEGAVCTLICDFSSLANGTHSILATGMFAVGVSDGTVTSYTTDDQSVLYTKNEDATTGIDAIPAERGVLEIYSLHGVPQKEPKKGQVNIINGKKVLPL